MSEIPPKAKHPIKAARTTFEILEALKDLDGAGISELADEVDLPKSSVHNYLSTLLESGYVVKEDRTYHLGLRFLMLGSVARQRHPLYQIAKPEVRRLAEDTGELVNLLVEEHGRGIYIYRELGDNAVGVDSFTGHNVHLHSTALGKSILAYTSEGQIDSIIDEHGLPALTDQTIATREELDTELAEIRERNGIAFDRQERLKGLRCVAVPIRRATGEVEGAISVSGPVSRMKGERLEEMIPEQLQDAANIIELNLNHE